MKKSIQNFLCTECGDSFSKWFGRCPSCNEFGTVNEFKESKILKDKKNTGVDLLAQSRKGSEQTNTKPQKRFSTNIPEFDRVLGDGFFPGSVLLFGGNPGIGKSTLSLQVFLNVENSNYFSGEESVEQIMHRAERLKPETKTDQIFSTNSLEDIVTTIEKNKPSLAIIDSIQMVGTSDSSFGTVSQIRENAEILVKVSKSTGTTILIIGHVTKNDEIAGPKILEHVVDTVLYLEGEANSEIRILRAQKNRFGSTMEIGVFEMKRNGLQEVSNPSEFFLAERAENSSGSAISVLKEGARNFLLEIQVLSVKTNFGQPRRTASGISLQKFHLLCAVISKFTPFKMENFDGYLNVVGGLRISEPAVDAAICAAILSSRAEKEISPDTVVFGEVGLSGEIRSVANFESRILESKKLGFKKIICPPIRGKFPRPECVKIVEIKTVLELMKEILED